MKHSVLLGLLVFFIYSQTSPAKVLVTGGAGFIGSHVAQALLDRGDEVVIIDNLCDAYDIRLKKYNLSCIAQKALKNQPTFYFNDICDKDALYSIFQSEKPDLICHLAARAGVRPSVEDPVLYMQANVIGTVNILEMAHLFGIKHVVIASSSSVYGSTSKIPFCEDDVCDKACSQYGATKRMSELLGYTYYHLYGISVNCLRFFTVYGPRGRVDMAPFKFLNALYNEKTFEQYGDGNAVRDFTYIEDIVSGVIKALDKPCGFEIFNLGRGEPVVLKDFIRILEEITGKQARIKQVENALGDVPLTFASIEKAKRMLGYEPKISVREGLSIFYDWYKNSYLFVVDDTY